MELPTSLFDSFKCIENTECSKCKKLNMCCEHFESSNVVGRCMRCNHFEKDHCLPPGSSSRPFPLLLYPTTATPRGKPSLILERPKIQTKEKIQKSKEEKYLLTEVKRLQDELTSARSLIKELLNNESAVNPSDYYVLESQLKNTKKEIIVTNNNNNNNENIEKLQKRNNNFNNNFKSHKYSLENIIYEKYLQKKENNINIPVVEVNKSLSKNVSRHTLITRGFISTHFKKLKGEDISSKLSAFILFSTLKELQNEFISHIKCIQVNCFEEYLLKQSSTEENNHFPLLTKYLQDIILIGTDLLNSLKSLPLDEHTSMREVLTSKRFKEIVENISKLFNSVLEYGNEFPTFQINLETLYKNDPNSTTLFINTCKEYSIDFTETILLPLSYTKNFIYFYSECLELITIKDPGFEFIIGLLSNCKKIEKQICEIVSNFKSTVTNLRSQHNLFSHKGGLLYDPNRELIYQTKVLLQNSESSNNSSSFFSSFIPSTLYIFSDSLIFSFDDNKESIIIDIKTIISVNDDISIFCDNSLLTDLRVKQIINSSFILVTLSQNYFICTNGISFKYETSEHILSSFRKFIQNNINYGSKVQRNINFEALDVFCRV